MSATLASFALDLERSRRPAPAVEAPVSPRLTGAAKRRRAREDRVIEPTDYAAMMRRMLRAHGRRVADADVEDLAELIGLEDELEAAIVYAVTQSRQRHGRSWADIGRAAGITRQSAQAKFGASR